MKRNISKIELAVATIIALFLVVGFPLLNASGMVADYTINVWGKYLCYGLLAISVDLLWGYTGLLSLGQALFFSLGGYMLGMNLMLMIGQDGQYYKSGNNPNLLPDFMVFLGHTFLPSFWRPFYSFPFAVMMVVAIPGLLALIFGFFAFRSRIKGVYFSILTQALTYAAYIFLLQNDVTMGGNNGFTDFKRILGYNLREPATQRGLYIATAAVLVGVYAFSRWLTTTKFGLVQRAIRDSETRVLFSGYAAANYKLFIFVIASSVAALGGALYVPQVGIINPGELATDKSLEAVVWCAVGGRGTIIGPIIGAIFVNRLKSWATTSYPDYWLIILGVMFILIVLFLPKGIYGLVLQVWNFLFKPKLDPTRDIVAVPEAEPTPVPETVGTPSK
ncbi:MAG: urea ABC transporter permease subunit UrtC [Chthoniobacter sp.]|uniref:urea ABC transporter permease subunit UrtC n=1 Tax=Chthoniobacter sp. TaxID=2510640 RepID=UPI0032A178A8